MAKRKKEFKWFTITQYEKEQEYLREMHNHGWKFLLVSGLGTYHFEECEPADVVYQLDYNREGLAHKEEYVQMFADCGWEYLQDFWGFSYFRKPVGIMNHDESIFCDDESRLQFLGRIFKGRLTPLLVILCFMIIPQIILQSMNEQMGLVCMWLVVLIIYLAVFIYFGKTYYDFKKRMQRE